MPTATRLAMRDDVTGVKLPYQGVWLPEMEYSQLPDQRFDPPMHWDTR